MYFIDNPASRAKGGAKDGGWTKPAGKSGGAAGAQGGGKKADAKSGPAGGGEPGGGGAESEGGLEESEAKGSDLPGTEADPGGPAVKDEDGEVKAKAKSWIEFDLQDPEGKVLAGVAFKVYVDGAPPIDGTTDDKGHARVEKLDGKNVRVSFPEVYADDAALE